jgi:hypothetical protein
MSETDKVFAGSIPQNYDRYLVPLIFQSFADDIARSSAPSPRHPAVAYCQGTPLRNEIEARDEAKLGEATDHAASAIAARHGSGEVIAKIQAHVIIAMA